MGLNLNIETKLMTNSLITDSEDIEVVYSFCLLELVKGQ